jgi:glycosyltransferase involved in cell wall biosynthesis
VATDVGDAASIVDVCGVVVPPRNPPLLAAAIGDLLERTDDELRHACRARIEQCFGMARMVQDTERLLQECLNGAA